MSRFVLSVAAALLGLGLTTADVAAKGGRGGGGRAERGGHHHGRHAAHRWEGGPTYAPSYTPAYAPAYAPPVAAMPAPVVEEEAPAESEAEPEEVMQVQSHLRVRNDTKEKLKVYVQYRTQGADDEWAWLPGDPKTSAAAVAYELEPGEEAVLGHRGKAISASRVRIWAVAEASGSAWLDNKDQDLWLVPEGDNGQYYYYAPEMESYTVTFSP